RDDDRAVVPWCGRLRPHAASAWLSAMSCHTDSVSSVGPVTGPQTPLAPLAGPHWGGLARSSAPAVESQDSPQEIVACPMLTRVLHTPVRAECAAEIAPRARALYYHRTIAVGEEVRNMYQDR